MASRYLGIYPNLCRHCVERYRNAGRAIIILTGYSVVTPCDGCQRMITCAMCKREPYDGMRDDGDVTNA